jgi:D-beta-D-heptose 7-phosphate kinase/D-beta-D-heptose 1-phosphate adenosyltransferase
MSRNQQLIRLDFEDTFSADSSEQLFKQFQKSLKACDVVVLSDNGKGTLHDIPALISSARN